MNRRHHLVALALATVVLAPRPAAGYSKFEHEQLTYYAFEIARAQKCEPLRGKRARLLACAGFDEITEAARERFEAEGVDYGLVPTAQLGGVTRAVDYFSHPWRLVPEAEACLDETKRTVVDGGCRQSVAKACATRGGAEACLDYILGDTLWRVTKRRNKPLWRAIAVHRNDSHFRKGARDQYNRMHQRAIDLAAGGHPGLALVSEAVAIHFLQDAFAPGHLAAPRDQYGDAFAGSLHDRWNSRGLPVWGSPSLCPKILEIARRLGKTEDGVDVPARFVEGGGQVRAKQQMKQPVDRALALGAIPGSQVLEVERLDSIPDGKWISAESLIEDAGRFQAICSEPISWRAFGDKRLLPGGSGRTEADVDEWVSRHRISLLVLAVESIREVLEAEEDADEALAVCFHPPTMETAHSGADRFWAPALAVGKTPAAWKPTEPCWPNRHQERLVFGFDTRPDRMDPYAQLPAGGHLVNGLQVAISYWGEERRRFEFAHDLVATERYHLRNDGKIQRDAVGQRAVGSLGYSVHHERDRQMVANGAGILYSYGLQHRDLDYYAAIEPGLAHYEIGGNSTTRVRGSVRLGVGWSLVAVEGIVEYGYEVAPSGALEREWRPSLNARFRLAPSWFSRIAQIVGR